MFLQGLVRERIKAFDWMNDWVPFYQIIHVCVCMCRLVRVCGLWLDVCVCVYTKSFVDPIAGWLFYPHSLQVPDIPNEKYEILRFDTISPGNWISTVILMPLWPMKLTEIDIRRGGFLLPISKRYCFAILNLDEALHESSQ